MFLLQSAGSGKVRKDKKGKDKDQPGKQQGKQGKLNKKSTGGPYKESSITLGKPAGDTQPAEPAEQGN